jgi:hypothetical protein
MIKKRKLIPLISFITFWTIFCLFSFSQLDLNLTLYNLPIIKDIISNIQTLGFYNRPLSTIIFIILSCILYTAYCILALKNPPKLPQLKTAILIILLISIPTYPLFSHDIFNYLFNAKMILVYKANPHLITASQFLFDPWTRFMHNVHTPAPYAYGWTAMSLIPVMFKIKNFTISLWSMKAFNSVFFVGESYLIYKIANKLFPAQKLKRTLLFLFNPLLLIETFIIGHNDSVMMFFALLSLYLFLFGKKIISKYFLSFITILISISIKYATIILAPLYLIKTKFKNFDIFTWGGFVLLAILLTRPGQLHSWYLHWGLTLLFLSKKSWVVTSAILLSFGGLIRYAPYLYYGHWDAPVPLIRYILLFLPLLFLIFPKLRKQLK